MKISKLVSATVLVLAFACMASIFAGCSSSPQLYPNKKYEDTGKDGAEADIKDCEKKADDFVSSSKGKKIAQGAGAGAVIGAATGGVIGLFTHSLVRGAVIGGAAGAAAGAAHGAMSPDQIKHNFVNKCLKDKGYDVIGWS